MKREPKWWKKSVVYQIYPRSFMDSNGDGIGDLPGVISRLDYVKELGCDAIWICPFYASSNYDNGYDITNYQEILADFGTLADVERLISEAHARGIRLIIDMVVNHTSCEHPWFLESKKGRENADGTPNPYREYYIWKPGKREKTASGEETLMPPNNWEAIFGGSAWSQPVSGNNGENKGENGNQNENGNDFYLHIFSPMQPDMNWESPKLREELYRMMRWWFDKGVDGFRMDAVCYISKDPAFPDSQDGNIRPYASFGPRFEEFAHELNREVLSRYENVMSVAEMSESTPERAEIFANEDGSAFSMIFQFQHMDLDGGDSFKWTHRKIDLPSLKKLMAFWQTSLYGRAWNSLYWCNHDQPRIFSRFGSTDTRWREKSAKMVVACTHMMQGTPYIFQGEELGMTNYPFRSIDEVRDIESINAWKKFTTDGTFTETEMLELISLRGRDNARTPMQWDDTQNAGFSTGKPWINVNPNYTEINAEEQRRREDSVFHFYRELIALRKKYEIITTGKYVPLDMENTETYAYLRIAPETEVEINAEEKLFVACNFTDHPASIYLPEEFTQDMATGYEVEILLTNDEQRTNITLTEAEISLRAYEAVIVRLTRKK